MEGFYFMVSYIVSYLIPRIKEEFTKSKTEFFENLWNHIKNDIHNCVKDAIHHVEEYMKTAEYETRENEVVDVIFKKVKLPLVFRPFKGILKKMFKNKVRALVAENLRKLDMKV